MKPAGTPASRILRNGWKQALLVLFSVLCLFPLYYLFVTAFKTKGEYLVNLFGLPLQPILLSRWGRLPCSTSTSTAVLACRHASGT